MSRFRFLFGLSALAAVVLIGCRSSAPAVNDYAKARSTFRTNLTLHEPAPQNWSEQTTPKDAVDVSYLSAGLKLRAWVSKPNGAKRPAVLFLHGGFAYGADDWEMAKPFRDAGFVVMMPAMRGENGGPGDFSYFYNEVDDVLSARDALAHTPGVDPAQIFVAGHSVGGTLTMLSAMASTGFRAAASFSGSPDQEVFAKGLGSKLPIAPSTEEFRMRSPLAFPTSFKCPARLYFGSQEPSFPALTQKLAELAHSPGLDVDAVEVAGDHLSAVPEEMRQAIEFFKSRMTSDKLR